MVEFNDSWQLITSVTSEGLDKFLVADVSGQHSIELYGYGATVVSWIHNSTEILYVSDNALLDGSKAIRGGIPVVFPQFGQPDKSLPQHGILRTSNWRFLSFASQSSNAVLEMELDSTSIPNKIWPYAFSVVYRVTLTTNDLECTLIVNNDDSQPFEFHTLLHTYFRITSLNNVVITGLSGSPFIDKVKNSILVDEDENPNIRITEETDRIYLDQPNATLPDIVLTTHNGNSIQITKYASIFTSDNPQEFNTKPDETISVPVDVVVWNPWMEKSAAMSDLGEGRYQNFVCVEPGTVANYVQLHPRQRFQLTQHLRSFP